MAQLSDQPIVDAQHQSIASDKTFLLTMDAALYRQREMIRDFLAMANSLKCQGNEKLTRMALRVEVEAAAFKWQILSMNDPFDRKLITFCHQHDFLNRMLLQNKALYKENSIWQTIKKNRAEFFGVVYFFIIDIVFSRKNRMNGIPLFL